VSLLQEEVATGGDCYQSGAGNAGRRRRDAFVGRPAVSAAWMSRVGTWMSSNGKSLEAISDTSASNATPSCLGQIGNSASRMARKSASWLVSHRLGTPMIRASSAGCHRLSGHQPRSQPTAARIAGCRNRGSGLAIPGTDQPVQPRGVAQGLRRGRCNLNCTFRVPK
jgi:hypothetical protein